MKKNNKKISLTLDNKSTKKYAEMLTGITNEVKQAQTKAIFSVNKELLKLYWTIGKTIIEEQKENGWGASVVEKLAEDLQNRFPGIGGFSRSNIFRIRAFYEAYEKVAQAARQMQELPIFNIPWYHNVILLQRVKNTDERLYYAQKSLEYGWSRSMLESWIKSKLYQREGKAITNFKRTLQLPHSDMAQQALKDPYNFDFLTLHDEHIEQDLEQGLIDNVEKLLLEMGKGFALIGRQYHLEVDEKDYYIDLLFYHAKLKCYIVVELKAREFDPRDVGQINFYLSAIDDLVRDSEDKPTIGLILCKTKRNVTAEYALRDFHKPLGIAEYETEILKKLPKELKKSLPTIEELEKEIEIKQTELKLKIRNMKRIKAKRNVRAQ